MKRFVILLLLSTLLVGCAVSPDPVKEGMNLRQRILNSSGCEFDAVIIASYSDCSYTFTLDCMTDASGDLTFTVKDPESISGISGTVTSAGGDLRFDDTVLGFDPVADGLLSPVGTPWLFMKVLRGGYLHAVQEEESGLCLILDDTYRSEDVRAEIMVNTDLVPTQCEIYWKGKRYLSMDVRNFVFL